MCFKTVYIDVDRETAFNNFYPGNPSTLVQLNVVTSGVRNRWFDLKVSYIPCDSPYRAPPNCLQYHYGLMGKMVSFNFDVFNQGFTYFNNLDYAICFRKPPGFCTVSFTVAEDDDDDDDDSTNDLFPDEELGNEFKKIRDKLSPSSLRPTKESTNFHIVAKERAQQLAGAGPHKCPADYLVLNNMRFCGHYLNEAALYRNGIKEDSVVIDNSTGPVIARFISSESAVAKGFQLEYQMNPCMSHG